jgi:hypothetical protein
LALLQQNQGGNMWHKVYIVAMLLFLFSCSQIQKQAVEIINPKVHFLIGEVTMNGQPAKFGYTIQNGDVIETGSQSYLEAHFGRQSAVRIREDSKVVFNITNNIELDVKKGKVLNILEKKSSYTVKMPTAVAAINAKYI